MSIRNDLGQVFSRFQQTAPEEVKGPIVSAMSGIKATFNHNAVIREGDALPEFKLPNALGQNVSSKELLAKGPVLITFYRGTWCPFCNIALAHLQKHLLEFSAKGVTLVAISPELPDTSLSETEKRGLTFSVLSDVGNGLARKLGIVWKQPDSLRPVFETFGHDLEKRNGDDSLEVPIPATLLVDNKGIVKKIYVEPNYTKRLDPEVALKWADELNV
ncbi:Fc.00g056810.m01.CDS01 [Cosmosporella sp. VM-42]